MSSIFQVEQEEAMKWVDRDENIAAFKSQETLDIVPPEDDGKPLDSALPTTDAKLTSQPTLKVSKTKPQLLASETLRTVRTGDGQM